MSIWNAFPTRQMVDDLIAQSFENRLKDTYKALEISERARELSLKLDYQSGFARSNYLVALCNFILGENTLVVENLYNAIELFESLDDKKGQADSWNILGLVFERRGEYDDAENSLLRCLELRRAQQDVEGEITVLSNIGLVYVRMARYPDALHYLFTCLELADSRNLPLSTRYPLLNISHVFAKVGDLENARAYLLQILELNKGTNDLTLESSLLTDLGTICAKEKQHLEAMGYLNKSLELAKRSGNIHDEGDAYLAMGLAFQENGEYQAAEEYFHRSESIMIQTRDLAMQAEILIGLGVNFMFSKDIPKAIELLSQALDLSRSIKKVDSMQRVHELLSQAYKAAGDYKTALDHHEKFHSITQDLYMRDSEKRIHAIVAGVQVRKFQREADLHKNKSEELARELSHARKTGDEKSTMLHQMERQSKMLEQLAREDGLTGLSNRRWLDIELNLEFERARRFDHPFSVAMIDLDNFKSVNDRFSHLVGDEVLRIAAKLLRTSCRDVDVVGRYGGEEFTLILIETTAVQGAKICAEILKQFREYPWTQVHPGLEKLTASVGVCDNNGKESPREMVATADELLYRAKKQGKDQVCNEYA